MKIVKYSHYIVCFFDGGKYFILSLTTHHHHFIFPNYFQSNKGIIISSVLCLGYHSKHSFSNFFNYFISPIWNNFTTINIVVSWLVCDFFLMYFMACIFMIFWLISKHINIFIITLIFFDSKWMRKSNIFLLGLMDWTDRMLCSFILCQYLFANIYSFF